jgi:membrane-bound inhibitor of C-type lysozyme
MRKTIAIAALATLAAACAPVGGPGASTFYACDRGTMLRVDFTDRAAFVRVNGGEALRLPQEPAASGTSYMTPQHSLRTRGSEAMWSVGRMAPEQCRQVAVPR